MGVEAGQGGIASAAAPPRSADGTLAFKARKAMRLRSEFLWISKPSVDARRVWPPCSFDRCRRAGSRCGKPTVRPTFAAVRVDVLRHERPGLHARRITA